MRIKLPKNYNNTATFCKTDEQAAEDAQKEKENRRRSLNAANISGINTKELPLLLLLSMCAEHCGGVHLKSVGNHLFTVKNNTIATVFSTLSTEKINSDDTHWARVHHFFVWKYLISFHFYTCKQSIAVHLVVCLTLQLCGSGK
ncbi:uncharacterized protein TM35_000081420 [Trypanosoma theileri]|uniref:Uncharacterized protein n=1 Tax=Trypanosoma theileri TaxID=67003 RepID=A0A1X0P074_9TRYP|nr:uncharacterized protein TM35_000081420 [Trypanosoma theileri]ORC90344.1 hypothetical protein TM35_000081420 [Trypanosoma theileri]